MNGLYDKLGQIRDLGILHLTKKDNVFSETLDAQLDAELSEITHQDILDFNQSQDHQTYTPYQELVPSTATLMFFFSVKLNMLPIWRLIRLDYDSNIHRLEGQIIWPGKDKEGMIFNCIYRDRHRGPCWKRSFKNSVTVEVSTSIKNISVKLSKKSSQMCGAKSVKDGKSATVTILKRVQEIYDVQCRIHNHPEEWEKVMSWFIEKSRRPPVRKYRRVVVKDVVGNKRQIKKQTILYELVCYESDDLDFPDCRYPDELDPVLAEFAWNYLKDFVYLDKFHGDFVAGIQSIKDLPSVYKNYEIGDDVPENTIVTENEIMKNYTYFFPTCVRRDVLYAIFDKFKKFKCQPKYHKDIHNAVTVTLPYEDSDIDPRIRRNKQKKTSQTAIIYKTGTITQSSTQNKGKIFYEIIKYIYLKYRNLIEDEELTRKRYYSGELKVIQIKVFEEKFKSLPATLPPLFLDDLESEEENLIDDLEKLLDDESL